MKSSRPLLEVNNFGLEFLQYRKGIHRESLEVITSLDIEVKRGEILAIVGSSGSGKSLLAHAILGILPKNARACGEMHFDGEILGQAEKEALRGKKIALVPQSVNYLDPLLSVGHQIRHAIKHGDTEHRGEHTLEIMARYGLEPEVFDYFPHQLSGGMARRVLLCTALAGNADLIIADEPTPGLDEGSLDEVLKDFRRLTDEGKAVLMITHDIVSAKKIADRIAIFYAGSTLESARSSEMSGEGRELRHPYTKALLHAMPSNQFEPTRGSQPLPGELPAGCLYFERCPIRTHTCAETEPPLRSLRGGKVRCFNAS